MCVLYIHKLNCGHNEIDIPPCGEEKDRQFTLRNTSRELIRKIHACGPLHIIKERVHRDCEKCDPEYREGATERYMRERDALVDDIGDCFAQSRIPAPNASPSSHSTPRDLVDDILWVMTRRLALGPEEELPESVTSRLLYDEQVLRLLGGHQMSWRG
jgi:hypothetical protein